MGVCYMEAANLPTYN